MAFFLDLKFWLQCIILKWMKFLILPTISDKVWKYIILTINLEDYHKDWNKVWNVVIRWNPNFFKGFSLRVRYLVQPCQLRQNNNKIFCHKIKISNLVLLNLVLKREASWRLFFYLWPAFLSMPVLCQLCRETFVP